MTDARHSAPRTLLATTAFLALFGAGPSRAAGPGKPVLTCLEIPVPARRENR